MLDIRPVVHALGWISCATAGVLCVPAVTDVMAGNPEWKAFVAASLGAVMLGVSMILSTGQEPGKIRFNIRQAFLITILGWVVVCFVGAVPFLSVGITFTDAVFETMSGITTTGSTVLAHLSSLPPGILLWRAILQFVGGIGIIAIAILILPRLRVGGMQMFKIESSDSSDERLFTAALTVTNLFFVYVALNILCGLYYYAYGMDAFDAATHAMATISTGGYSTHDESFAYFGDQRLHWGAIVFMISGAVPFMLYIKVVRGNLKAMVTDQQVKGFIGFLVVSSFLMAIWLIHQREIGFFDALTLTAFNITSVVTTTGFASTDYTTWGPGAVGMFLVLTFVGGCSGSTSGAIKIYRFQIVMEIVRVHIRRRFSPNRIMPLRMNGKPLPKDVPYSVLAFLTVFVATIAAFTVLLSLMGLDIVTAYSSSVTAITNTGPGIGDIVGPAGNFSTLPDGAKWILTLAMLAGRLEVLALLVAFDPAFWRD